MVILEANTSWDPGPRWVQPCKAAVQVLGERPDELRRPALQTALRGVCLNVADAGKGSGCWCGSGCGLGSRVIINHRI